MDGHRDRIGEFEKASAKVRQLDFEGKNSSHPEMYRQYQRRNSFGLNPKKKLYRIFQERYYEEDKANGFLTLPRAASQLWGDALENPLSTVTAPDPETGGTIYLGSLTKNFHALCWTQRKVATQQDWDNFAHGRPAVRITTSVGKLLDRVMHQADASYMHRSWLIDVDYQNEEIIKQLQSSEAVYERIEPSGALLALSAAIVRTDYAVEDEVRFLFDNSLASTAQSNVVATNPNVIRISFDWEGFVENIERSP